MENSRKIALLTLGCKLNYAETSTYERGFVSAGMKAVPWNGEEKPDLFVINTCSVTEVSDKKGRNLIRKMHRINPLAPIIVTGCYAELAREEVAGIEGVALVFGAKEKNQLVPKTLEYLSGNAVAASPDNTARTLAEEYREISKTILPAFSSGERTRSFLKVQDGCNNFCAYCTVPYARGESRNIPICEAVKQAEMIAAQGMKEIVLTGVNTGDFGKTTGESFLDLLKALQEVEGIERYRISSIEPNLITEEIIDWIAEGCEAQTGRRCKILPHFHIPLQNGTDEILKSMGRHYDTAFFKGRIDMIRRKMEGPGKPAVFFGIDVMAGLPGETEELFRKGMDFLAEVKPAFIHIFPYSVRPGTRASSMPGHVPENVKKERVARMEVLCERLHSEFIASQKGIRSKVLFESSEKDGSMFGYSENYIKVERPYDEALSGQIVEVTL